VQLAILVGLHYLYISSQLKDSNLITRALQKLQPAGVTFLDVDKDKNGTFESASWETNVDFDGDGVHDWIEVVTIFKTYGWEWGGDWRFVDKPHFQKTFGKSVKDLQALCNNKKVVNGYVVI
jgi:hypothetical protein